MSVDPLLIDAFKKPDSLRLLKARIGQTEVGKEGKMNKLEAHMMEIIIYYLPELIKQIEKQNQILERLADLKEVKHGDD